MKSEIKKAFQAESCRKSDWPNWIVPIIAALLGVIVGYYLNLEPGLDYSADPPELVLKGGAPEKEIKITITNSHRYPRFDKPIVLKYWIEGEEMPSGLSIMLSSKETPLLVNDFTSIMTIMADESLKGKEYDINYKSITDNSGNKGVLVVQIV